MSREVFLNSIWKSYPQPEGSLFHDPDWFWGTVQKIEGPLFWMVGESEARPIALAAREHAQLGLSVPSAVLRPGDSVAYHQKEQHCYLLSPCQERPSEAQDENESQWQRFLEVVRSFFVQKGFVHIWTPYLVPSSGIDAHIDFFKVQGVRTGNRYFLPTSPEFALKKALISGQKKVFEMKSCFRDDDPSPIHRPEFTMIEWYRAYADKWELMVDFMELIHFVNKNMNLSQTNGLAGSRIQETKSSMADLFLKSVGVSLTPKTTKQELQNILIDQKLDWSETDDWDDLFFRIYIEKIEPFLGKLGPQAVFDFPFSQGSLARETVTGWADRFEIYWQGIELANAYQEQNSPDKVEQRYREEVLKRESLGRPPHEVDESFIRAMRRGLPPSAGIALGLDRLWMVLSSQQAIFAGRNANL